MVNHSSPVDFLLLGFSENPGLERILFVLVLISYLVTLVGNTLIILLSTLDPRLHSPMYFFLSNLSFLDLCITTSFVPQMLFNLWGPNKTISFLGCSVQLFIFLFLGTTECVLLTVMAFDRYVAVCQPLHYATVIHPRLCRQLAAVAWVMGLVQSTVQTPPTLRLPFCPHRQIDDFVCEVPSLIQLACGDTSYSEIQLAVSSVIFLVMPLTLILISYGAIARAVLRINSATVWRKALGTCSSHLTVVTIFYSLVISVYLQPKNPYAQKRGKFFGLFYAVGTPSLNPLIYTLRNKEVMVNHSSPADFLLLGFSEYPGLERILFVLVLASYLMTLVGNTLIILLSVLEPRLHSPMYFFLSNLSFLDLCFTTSCVPQMLVNLWGPNKTISFLGCSVQLFIFLFLGTTECVLLTVMAFDRYVAVCQPLHYTTVIHPRLCRQLAAMAWVIGLVESVVQTPPTLRLPFCSHQQVDDFVCEVPALIQLSCGDTSYNEIQMAVTSVFTLVVPLSLILISYGAIARAVLRINSATAWRKALGTCSSHLTVVTLFYSSAMAVYLQSKNPYAQKRGKFFGLFYAVGTPSLNLLIYTLRNKEIKRAFRRLLGKDVDSRES
ncbi:olfactory receptor 2H1-like protein [Camelus ferus]|nr:olfactory receptor 2H1-like protein [Camelus ferus]